MLVVTTRSRKRFVLSTEYEYIEDEARAREVREELLKHKVLAGDTETTGLDPFTDKLLLLQLGHQKMTYVLDCRKVDPKVWEPVLVNPSILKIFHNLKFDYKFIRVQAGIKMRNGADTMLAEKLLWAGLAVKRGMPKSEDAGERVEVSMSLAGLCERYLGIHLDKNPRENFIGFAREKFSEEELRYAARDVQVLLPIFSEQAQKLRDEGMTEVARLEMATLPVVGDMELRGWVIDVVTWREHIAEHARLRDQYGHELLEMMGMGRKFKQASLFEDVEVKENFTVLNSQERLLQHLAALGGNFPSTDTKNILKPFVLNAARALEVDDQEFIDAYGGREAIQRQLEFIEKLLEYREHEKLVSTYGENLLSKIHPVTGRLHPEFDQLGTDTGRFSSQNPNGQNMPKHEWIRHSFRGAPGTKIVTSDYSQIEMRILADLCQDPKFLEALFKGRDLHAHTAALMHGLDYDEYVRLKKADAAAEAGGPPMSAEDKARYKLWKKYRSGAKAINFGLVYGLGAGGLAKQLGIPVEEAKQLIELYFNNYPTIRDWLDKQAKLATIGHRKGEYSYAITPLGRKRYFKLPPDSLRRQDYNLWKAKMAAIERMGKNTPIQGASADVTKLALVTLDDNLERFPLTGIVSTVHDEIVVETPAEYADEVRMIVQNSMEEAARRVMKVAPVKAECMVDDYWTKD